MRHPLLMLITSLVSLALSLSTWAQRVDKPGSQDHPLLSRFEGSIIDAYEELQFDQYALPTGPAADGKVLGDTQTLEGQVTKINYIFWEEPKPSLLQLYRSYEQGIASQDVEVLFSCFKEECALGGADLVKTAATQKKLLNGFMAFGEHAYLAGKVARNDTEIYFAIFLKQERKNVAYELHFVEVESMDTGMITMSDIQEGMEETGKQAFYGLYFDTGNASLKASSLPELTLMAEYLTNNAEAEYFVVGHTDNTGTYATNQSLAVARAASVVRALQEQFDLNVENLKPVGVGPVSPVATNSTQSGRAENRRVELVLR